MKILATSARNRLLIGFWSLISVQCGGGGMSVLHGGAGQRASSGNSGGAAQPMDAATMRGDAGADSGNAPDSGRGRDASTQPMDGSAQESDASSPLGSMMIMPVPGQVDPNAPPNSGLPDLARLNNVKASVVGDSVTIAFDPIDSAVDYRVYALPAKDAITASGDGHLTIKNAVYRCSGNRQAPTIPKDTEPQVQSGALRTLVDGQKVDGTMRTLAQATLGYVYAEAGADRIPVYALGEHSASSDNSCFFQRFTASRVKQYITADADRSKLLAQGFRDDGIVFYVPAKASSATQQVMTSGQDARYYFVSGSENRANPSPAFDVLREHADGSVPLMRAFYQNGCGRSHDELVAGQARFNAIRGQGDHVPVTKLHWSGLTAKTTLVVEALDAGCPFAGVLGPKTLPASGDYLAWKTPNDAQTANPNHELFINGQFDGTNPRPIARSFVTASPAPAPDLDWSFGFSPDDDLGKLDMIPCGMDNCFNIFRMKSSAADITFLSTEPDRYAHGKFFGEWWVAYSDWAADTNGKYRLTPPAKGDINADSYLFVSMEVDSFTTTRRYPQILISDRDAPVQQYLAMGNTLIIQTFGDWPNRYEVQVCDHRVWEVNNQCPRFDLYQQQSDDSGDVSGLAPNVEVGEQIGMDHSNRYEAYVSSKRAYLFLDGQPYGCADLPAKGTPSGPVTVTFGDVLYHSGVDATFAYTGKYRQTVSVRHFDNLGFKSHVAAPPWDESRLPCSTRLNQ